MNSSRAVRTAMQTSQQQQEQSRDTLANLPTYAGLLVLALWAAFNWYGTFASISRFYVTIPTLDYWRVAEHLTQLRNLDFRFPLGTAQRTQDCIPRHSLFDRCSPVPGPKDFADRRQCRLLPRMLGGSRPSYCFRMHALASHTGSHCSADGGLTGVVSLRR